MRRLILFRHAKSGRPAGVADIDRPLAKSGREAAARMAAYLAEEQLLPDLVLVSPSRRTRETWDLAAATIRNTPMRVEESIYEASPYDLLSVIRSVEPEARALALVGHNPGFEDLARLLVGHGDRYAFARMAQKFPTAAIAVIDFDAEGWSDIEPRSGRLDRFVTPKSLGLAEDD